MRNYIQKYFYHTRGERMGTLVLLACILLSVAFRYIKLTKSNAIDSQYSKELAMHAGFFFEKAASNENSDLEVGTSQNPFNPNEATREELVAAGLPPRIANILIHYREKGGFFKTKEDLKKIYGVTPALFAQLEPRILLAQNQPMHKNLEKNWKSEINNSKIFVLKNFDPNTVTEEELLTMGLEKRIVKIWLNYRDAGKIFKKKQDVEKIYGMTPEIFKKIETFIQINDNQVIVKKMNTLDKLQNTNRTASELNYKLDLNSATIDELLRLHGIGRIFALRIVKYREDLGGFVEVNQLKEIENFPDSTFYSLAPMLFISGKIQQLHVNNLSFAEIKHPYLTKKQILSTHRYKINHGDFKNFVEMSKIGVFSQEQLDKIKPYLAFD